MKTQPETINIRKTMPYLSNLQPLEHTPLAIAEIAAVHMRQLMNDAPTPAEVDLKVMQDEGRN